MSITSFALHQLGWADFQSLCRTDTGLQSQTVEMASVSGAYSTTSLRIEHDRTTMLEGVWTSARGQASSDR